MAQSTITTPEGFRQAIEDFDALLDTLSAEQAATLVDQIKGAAPKACKRFAADDLEDLQVRVEALKNRLRRKWKRQRSNNAWSTAVGGACGAAAATLAKFAAIPAGAIVALIVLGGVTGLLGVISLLNVTDWREEVTKPFGEVADTIAKALADKTDNGSAYRSPPAGEGSTGVRATPTIDAEFEGDERAGERADPERRRR